MLIVDAEVKMIFKPKTVVLGLIFIAGFFVSILQAAELFIPLPQDAIKVSERTIKFGPDKLLKREYETFLTEDRLSIFYKKEMSREGWIESKKSGYYTKDNDSLVIEFKTMDTATSKTRFSVLISKVISDELVAGSVRKKNPDKLRFMPVYPGSEQVLLWDSGQLASAKYETKDSIKDIVFFYKNGMLNYGWRFIGQTSESKSEVILKFQRKEFETCEITISAPFESPKKPGYLSGKTTISAVYSVYIRERKKI